LVDRSFARPGEDEGGPLRIFRCDQAAGSCEFVRRVLSKVDEQQPPQVAELSLLPALRLQLFDLYDRRTGERYETRKGGSVGGEMEPLCTEGEFTGQLRRTPEGRGGRPVAHATLGVVARLLESGGCFLVDAYRGCREMPGAGVAGEYVREPSVSPALGGRDGRMVDGRAREWMAEDDSVLDDAQEATVLCRCEALWREGAGDRRERVGDAGARDQKRLASIAGEALEPTRKRSLERRPDAQWLRKRFRAGQLLRRQRRDDLLERERIPAGQGHEPLSNLPAHHAHGGEQLEGVILGQACHGEDLDARQIELTCPRRYQYPDRPVVQPPDRERERVRRPTVEPLGVVDKDEHGP
jgi:hypothetical protein